MTKKNYKESVEFLDRNLPGNLQESNIALIVKKLKEKLLIAGKRKAQDIVVMILGSMLLNTTALYLTVISISQSNIVALSNGIGAVLFA